MYLTKENLKITTESNNEGEVKLFLSNLADFEGKNPKLRTFALAQLKPGEEVEFHIHEGESESYYIISGKGEYNDNGNVIDVHPGTVTYTPSGTGHGIKNNGDEMLEFIALILLDYIKGADIMSTYIVEFLKRYDYPADAVDAILSAYKIFKYNKDFNMLIDSFYTDASLNAEKLKKELDEISKKEAVNLYTTQLVFLVCLTPLLKKEYEKAGIDENIYFDTVEDLKFKLIECYDVEKVWGIIPFGWFVNHFRLKTFALGRLQFNMGTHMGEDATIAGRAVKNGDIVINIHIPSSGRPFDKQSRIDSYEKAYCFFKDRFGGNEPIFRCETWLLNPPNREILGEKSNITSFMDDFKIVASYEYSDNSDMWRIFGADADLPPAQLPRKTSMQRAIADWLEKGNRLGAGIGLFMFDPINKNTIK